MDNNKIKRIFKNTYNGAKNFITPEVIGYGKRNGYIYEISKGEFMKKDMFGLTVLTVDGNKTDKNNSFDSREELKEAINNI